ncbi:hypothetical protein KL925_002189 [Ogataea polymorpha]|nr:hypothetical protein KL925_002189 [Ogataea polymorpha]
MKQDHPGYTQGKSPRGSMSHGASKGTVLRAMTTRLKYALGNYVVVEAGDELQRGHLALTGEGGSPGTVHGQKPVLDSGFAFSRV